VREQKLQEVWWRRKTKYAKSGTILKTGNGWERGARKSSARVAELEGEKGERDASMEQLRQSYQLEKDTHNQGRFQAHCGKQSLSGTLSIIKCLSRKPKDPIRLMAQRS
jgi:hypothetical protein